MRKVAIGIDIGGTNIKMGLVDRHGHIRVRVSILTKKFHGRERLFEAMIQTAGSMKLFARRKHLTVAGIGIGAPGPIDVDRGFVYFFPNISGWKDTELKKRFEQRLGLKTYVDNDANVMTLAETRFGAGRGAKNIIALTLGTGVGGGLVIGGRLFHGPRYSAAEIGHLIINEKGPRCGCGNRGCLESYVGNGHFIREVRRRLKKGPPSLLRQWVARGRELTPELIAEAARKKDPFACTLWSEVGDHLGSALAGLVNILNPERIIIGGGIAQAGKLLFKPIRASLKKKAFPIAVRSVKVLPVKLGVDSGLIGAASLVFEP